PPRLAQPRARLVPNRGGDEKSGQGKPSRRHFSEHTRSYPSDRNRGRSVHSCPLRPDAKTQLIFLAHPLGENSLRFLLGINKANKLLVGAIHAVNRSKRALSLGV